MTLVKMTGNQHRVFQWLQSRTNFKREVKCSARKIALEFNFSDQYAMKILDQLEAINALFLLRRGTGQRANKYRVEVLNPSQIYVPKPKRVRIPTVAQNDLPSEGAEVPTPEGASTDSVSRLKSISYLNSDPGIGKKALAFYPPDRGHARATSRLTVLTRLTLTPRRDMRSPFNRFEKKKHNPETWNAQDVVCYYALLFRYIYGSLPMIVWRRDTAAAKNLLVTWGDGKSTKLYLQVVFGLVRRDWTIGSLMTFTHESFINMAIQTQEMEPAKVARAEDEYQDKYVMSS